MFQESCAQPEVTIFHLGRSSSFHRKTQRYYYVYSLRRSLDSAISLHYCSLTAFCKVRELEKARLEKKKKMKLALYRKRSPLVRREGAAVRLVRCCAKSRRE